MRTINLLLIFLGGLAFGLLLLLDGSASGRFTGSLVIVTMVGTLVGLNLVWPRAPHLVVEYRNTVTQRSEVWKGEPSFDIVVFVRNAGRGAAEAVEVRFESRGEVYNESGNSPDPATIDITVHPPRFVGRERVLEPGDEWAIALLPGWRGDWISRPALTWQARARRMAVQTGSIEIAVVAAPGHSTP